jgi:hypothetical protein
MIRRLQAIPAAEFAKPVCAEHAQGGCSLSPRESVRVRGNNRSPATKDRVSKSLLSNRNLDLLWHTETRL